MNNKIMVSFIFLIIVEIVTGQISINEIMYNPEGNDNNQEYIEIHLDMPTNLTGYIIEDSTSEDIIELVSYYNSTYALIVEEGFNFSGLNSSIYSAGPTIGSNLNNKGEALIIRDKEKNILDIVSYSPSWGGDGNGFSIERKSVNLPAGDSSNWAESTPGGTPGEKNSVSRKEGCDWTASILLNDSVTKKMEFKVIVKKNQGEGKVNLTVVKWIEDHQHNIIKTYSPWIIEDVSTRRTSSKYSPGLEKNAAYFIRANITESSCEETNISNNFVSELVFLSDEENTKSSNSSIKIIKFPESTKYGDLISLSVNIYRGNTSKYAVYYYIEDSNGNKLSEKMSLHINEKYRNYTLKIPLQIKPNCNQKLEDGEKKIIVEGMGIKEEKELLIEGITESLCQTIEIEKEDTKKRGSLRYDITEIPQTVYLNQPFDIVLKIENEYADDVELDVWSYVYRGGKRYSNEYENLKHIIIESEERRIITLKNNVIEGKEGEYNLKVKIKKKGRKTTYDKTKSISLKLLNSFSDNTTLNHKETVNKGETKETAQKNDISLSERKSTVYESKNIYIKESIPFFLLVLFSLAVIFALIKIN